MKKILVLIMTSLMMLLVVTGCGSAPKTEVLPIMVGPNPDTIDPALNSAVDGGTIIITAFEGLFRLDKGGIPQPAQAKSVDVSEDGTVYTFHLRENLKWSDGSSVTASDFVYSWNRAVDPATAADYEYMFDVVKGYEEGHLAVEATDDLTLVVTLTTRTPYFLELTAFPVYMPVKGSVVEVAGEAWATDVATYISNGPYKMTEWVPSSHITFVKNPDYWNVKALGAESIKFVLMEDDVAALSAFKAGEILFTDNIPNDELDALATDPAFNKEGQIGTYYVSYNLNDPKLANPKLREALTLAINRPYIVTNIGKAGQVPAGAFVSLGFNDVASGSSFREVRGDYYDPNDYEGNLAKAKAIMAELYPDGKGIPSFSYIHNTSTGHKLIAEALQQDWKAIGVEVSLENQEWATFLNTRKNHQYEIARNGWLADYNDPITMLDLFLSTGGNNDGAFNNAEFDALIKEIKTNSDPAARFAAMHKAEDVLFSEWACAPIYYYVDVFMLSTKVKGFYSSPLGFKTFIYSTVTK